VTVLPVIVARAIEFVARCDRHAVLNKHEWSGTGQDFDGKIARCLGIWNVQVGYGIHKVLPYA
jgi:hypothetical protein